MTRTASPTVVAVGSLVALAGIVIALWWREHEEIGQSARPLIVYVAPTSRLPMEDIAADYERETGQRVELRFGPSEDILNKARFPSPSEPADLFMPADDSYIRQARNMGLIGESVPVARVRAVLLLAKGNPKGVASWADLLRLGVRVAVPNPSAAVGKLARDHLEKTRKWDALKPHVVGFDTVSDAANATRVSGAAVDAAVVWDAVANAPSYRGQTILAVPELTGVTGRVEIAVLNQSRDIDAAQRFAHYVAAPNSLVHFRAFGFRFDEPGGTR